MGVALIASLVVGRPHLNEEETSEKYPLQCSFSLIKTSDINEYDREKDTRYYSVAPSYRLKCTTEGAIKSREKDVNYFPFLRV